MAILVTGGLGFIGSHVCLALEMSGEEVFILDDLSSNSVLGGKENRIVRDLNDVDGIALDLVTHGITEIVHLAGKKNVTESIQNPGLYFRVNVGLTSSLLAAALQASVNTIVFSSSCSVYGERATERAIEPRSPYAASKFAAEAVLHGAANLGLIKVVSLRYFNAAGASQHYRIGERSDISLNLIPRLARAVLAGETFSLASARETTRDGTCVRDYVHVDDLANAHLAALDDARGVSHLSEVFDIGSGTGTTTLEVLRAVEFETGRSIDFSLAPPRAGDPASAVAPAIENKRLPSLSTWAPKIALAEVVSTALRWHHYEALSPRASLPDLSKLEKW